MENPPRYLPEDPVATYRYLRIAMVALIAFLGASMILTTLSAKCWQSSISHYFYTTTHAVFVASLCAMGILLIVYHGSKRTEDVLLDFSGALAFVVALVPTRPESLCGPGLPTSDDATGGVNNNVVALLIGAVVGLGTYWLIRAIRRPRDARNDQPSLDRSQAANYRISRLIDKVPKWLTETETGVQAKSPWILLTLLALWVLFLFLFPDAFKAYGHNIAAVLMFGGIILVVFHYAYYAAKEGSIKLEKTKFILANIYVAVACFILVTLIVAVLFSFLIPGRWTILIEVLLILEYAAFWVVQTFDLWKDDTYSKESVGG